MRKTFSKKNKRVGIISLLVLSIITISVGALYSFSKEEVTTEDTNEADITEILDESEVQDEIEDEIDEEIQEEVEPVQEETPSETEPITAVSNWWDYPATISPTQKDGNDLLVLVNKSYQLPSTYTPSDLVVISNVNMRLLGTFYNRSIIINDLTNLGSAASTDGIDLAVKSAYRSYSTQASTYQYWVNYNGGNVAVADTISARPGHSQHQLGTTIDFTSSEAGDQIGDVFHNTLASEWLLNNAWKYGFVISYPQGAETITGYAYESWHYRYIGIENAVDWYASGLTLEEWLVQQ